MSLQFQHRSHRVLTDFSQPTIGLDPFTYSLWVKPTAAPASINRYLHGTGGSGETYIGPIGGIVFSAKFSLLGVPTVYTWTTDDTAQPVSGTEYHIAVVFNGTDGLNGAVIYINGYPAQLSTTTTMAGLAYYQPTGNWGLLNAVAGGGGQLAHYTDVRLYNRALSPMEIASIYEQKGQDGIVNGLLTRAMFDEKVAGAVAVTGNCKDISPRKATLTLQVVSSTIKYSNELSYVQPVRRRS